MKIICIDTGNSRSKVAVYSNRQILMQQVFEQFSQMLDWLVTQRADIVVFSNVSEAKIDLSLLQGARVIIVDGNMQLPFSLDYHTPHTLGADRIAAVAAAKAMYPQQNVLVFDCGTCMTIDLLLANGVYKGGAISPGLQMRLNAMHHFTGKLPSVDFEYIQTQTAQNTKNCMISGAFYGMLLEIQGNITHYQKLYDGLQIIITGGDADKFVNHIKNNIFATPDLVLQGMNEIALYHVSKGI
jgi:type III pantothenate kinase